MALLLMQLAVAFLFHTNHANTLNSLEQPNKFANEVLFNMNVCWFIWEYIQDESEAYAVGGLGVVR